MKKRIFGIKAGTILTALGCLAVAVLLWLVIEYTQGQGTETAVKTGYDMFRGFI